ncbi:MAG: sulfur carrier protein ThiS [Hyphomonadaceae bacterium]|nr:sulfur carrier protein ThiS [Hyphomonadaceae bacterium]MBC6412120.1 sulfur carrier protein ThiS [Hyphomonadaceae bacterium]
MLVAAVWRGKPYLTGAKFLKLIINGKEHFDLPDSLTVAGLIAHLGLPDKKIAIERNREVVPKSTFDDLGLSDGDRLEIIHFIGGG